MSRVYAIVLTEQEFCGRVSYSNKTCPYIVGDDESETRRFLESQFPDGWVVIGPKEFLIHYGFDLQDDENGSDFDNAHQPTGIPPTILPHEEDVENTIRKYKSICWFEDLEGGDVSFNSADLEEIIINECPESELTTFILHTRKEISEKGLRGMSAANFAKGDVPLDFILSRVTKRGTFERLAFETNSLMRAVESGEGETLTFNDGKKRI